MVKLVFGEMERTKEKGLEKKKGEKEEERK